MSTRWKIFAAILIIFLGLTAYRIIEKSRTAGEKIATALWPVETIEVKRGKITDKLVLPGNIRGYHEAKIFSRVPGRISRRVKSLGEKVAKDETIITVDRDEPALEFSLAEVKAPFSGVITRYFQSEGELINPSMPLGEIASLEKVRVIVHVSERDLGRIAVGQNARFSIDSHPKINFSGSVVSISRSLDSITRTATAEIIADNRNELLKPGMFAEVEITVAAKNRALIIPRDAVILDPERLDLVFVVENNKAVSREIKLGLVEGNKIEVVSGLKEGEKVVTVGQYNLYDGAEVYIYTPAAHSRGGQVEEKMR